MIPGSTWPRAASSANVADIKSAITGKLDDINRELKSPFVQLEKFLAKILNLIGIDVGAKIDSSCIKSQLAGAQAVLGTAFDVGIAAQEKGEAATPTDRANEQELAASLGQRVDLDGVSTSIAEVILRGAEPELQGKVIKFIGGLPFNERRAICRGMPLDRLARGIAHVHLSDFEKLKSAAKTSALEDVSEDWQKAAAQRLATHMDRTAIAAEIGEISGHGNTAAIRSQLANVRTKDGAVAALQLLRTPEMLNQLKQLEALGNDSIMIELISTASGHASEILQNYGMDRSTFVVNVDATISAIAHSRRAVANPSAEAYGAQDHQLLTRMNRENFVRYMAVAEEWYFNGQRGDFPEALIGIKDDIVAWFEKSAERNFYEIPEKIAPDSREHFRTLAQNEAMLKRITGNVMTSFSTGVESAYVTLIENQSRGIRKIFTNLSLAYCKSLSADGDDGAQVANDYCSVERYPLKIDMSLHTVETMPLDTFWCQNPTEDVWGLLFTQRPGESSTQRAKRVAGFLSMHPQDGSHSTNFFEYLSHAPCAEQVSLDVEHRFENAAHEASSEFFWSGLGAVFNNKSIPKSEQAELWRQVLAPLNDPQAWRDAGPHTGNNCDAIATIGRSDYQIICNQMRVCGLEFDFEFDEDTVVRTRASDLAFYSGQSGETMAQKVDYLTMYVRVQPKLPE